MGPEWNGGRLFQHPDPAHHVNFRASLGGLGLSRPPAAKCTNAIPRPWPCCTNILLEPFNGGWTVSGLLTKRYANQCCLAQHLSICNDSQDGVADDAISACAIVHLVHVVERQLSDLTEQGRAPHDFVCSLSEYDQSQRIHFETRICNWGSCKGRRTSIAVLGVNQHATGARPHFWCSSIGDEPVNY